MNEIFRLGSVAGFSGDRVDGPLPVVETLIKCGGPSAIMFEVIGERTLALAQLERRKNSEKGYEPALEELMEPILAKCVQHGIPIIGNFGQANPIGAAKCIARVAKKLGLSGVSIGVVTGDDAANLDLSKFEITDSDSSLEADNSKMITANVYLGAAGIVEALDKGAQIVVTGRVSDPALALGPLIHHFGWKMDDWDKMGAATLIGHLLECGTHITGGYFCDPGFKEVPDLDNTGFPIAEVFPDGSVVITKADNTGGIVNIRTVKEQMLYEIHDPANYLTPDVVLDMTNVTLREIGPNRVHVSGARGKPRPEKLKASVSFEAGFMGEGEISYAGPNAVARATLAGEILLKRLERRALKVTKKRVDLIGVSSVHDSDNGTLRAAMPYVEHADVRVRLAVMADDRDTADKASREVLAMLNNGPASGGGARWNVTAKIKTISYLVPRDKVPTQMTLYTSEELE